MKYVWKFMKFSVVAIIVLMFGVVTYRFWEKKSPDEFTFVNWNELSLREYEENKDGFEVDDWIIKKNYSDKGRFFINDIMHLKTAEQIQFTVSYNKSTLRYLGEEKGLSDVPDEDSFVYALVVNDKEEIYDDYGYASEASQLHHYKRLVFDGIDMENVETITLYIYYADDCSYDSEPYATITFYSEYTEIKNHKISAKEVPEKRENVPLTYVSDAVKEVA